MPLNRIVEALNSFIKCAEEGKSKGAAQAINAANAAYLEIDNKPSGRKEAKQKLKEIYEKFQQDDVEGAIEGAVEFRRIFEGALQMQNQIISQFQEMKNAGIDPVQMAKDMPEFQTIVGSLCYRFFKPQIPENVFGLFGMLEALEEGLRGENENNTVDEILDSVEYYQNDYHISPKVLIGDVKKFMDDFPFVYKARAIQGSLKEFLVTFIHWELGNKLKEANRVFDLKDGNCFEGALATALEFGLLYHLRDPGAAKKLAKEFRAPTPY